MSTVLTNGIIIPDNGSRNWGGDLANNWNIIDLNVGYMTDVKNRVTTLENSVAKNSANIEINTSNISALQTSKQDVIEDLETIRAGASAGATAVQPNALNNYVDLSSEQTISGAKTFSFIALKSSRIERGALPAANITEDREIEIVDRKNRRILGIFNYYYATSSGRTAFYAYNPNTTDHDNIALAFDFNNVDQQKSLMPVANKAVNLGTSTNMWKDVYATTFNGNLVGNADTATKATNNASGNELSNDIIKGLSVNGKVITYTKLDGSTGTITTQDTNTDTKVTNTLGNTTKAYITGTTSATTNTGTQIFDSGVYLTTTAGQLHADIDFPITEAQIAAIVV